MKIILYSLLGILLIGSISFFVWSQFSYKPTKEALSLVDDKKDEDYIAFWRERCENRCYFLSRSESRSRGL